VIPISELIEEFYRACYGHRPMKMVWTSDTPRDMMVHPDDEDENEWFEWKLVERSQGIAPGFEDIEKECGHALPESFKQWHSRYFMLDGDLGMVRLPEIPSNDPFGRLREIMFGYEPASLIAQGLVPFAYDGNDGGALCFDTRKPAENNEWSILFHDHEWNEIERMEIVFTSFRKLLECCIHVWDGTLMDYPGIEPRYKGFAQIDPKAQANITV
jgi:hypothetical protein